eukprot:7303134-Pyramimonas_sp.AAC.1
MLCDNVRGTRCQHDGTSLRQKNSRLYTAREVAFTLKFQIPKCKLTPRNQRSAVLKCTNDAAHRASKEKPSKALRKSNRKTQAGRDPQWARWWEDAVRSEHWDAVMMLTKMPS